MQLPAFKFRTYGNGVEIYQPCLVLRPEVVSLSNYVRIDSFTKLEGGEGLRLGNYVHIGSFAHVNIGGGEVDIGVGVAICSGAKVLGGSNHKRGFYMSVAAPEGLQHIERGHTVIGEGAFIGVNATVLYDVIIGKFAIVAAGAVVTHDVPEREIWAGVPARKIGERRHG